MKKAVIENGEIRIEIPVQYVNVMSSTRVSFNSIPADKVDKEALVDAVLAGLVEDFSEYTWGFSVAAKGEDVKWED